MPPLNRETFLYQLFVFYRVERDLALVPFLVAEKASSNNVALRCRPPILAGNQMFSRTLESLGLRHCDAKSKGEMLGMV